MDNPVTNSVDVQKLMSLADDLTFILKNNKDKDILTLIHMTAESFRVSSDEETHEVHDLSGECRRMADDCKRRISEVESEIIPDAELENLQKQLEYDELRERLLREELRGIEVEIADMDQQRMLLEERMMVMKRKNRGLLKSQKMLSMCTCVTRIIPDMGDPSKISGYIVDKDKKHYEKFEFNSISSPYEVCNSLWQKVGQ